MAVRGIFGGECVETHSAFIFDRGGKRPIGQVLDISEVKWSRERDAISEAQVTIIGDSCTEQRALVNQARTRRHELVIFRGQERVWEGPLHRIASHSDRAVFVARDIFTYIQHTSLSQAYDNRAKPIFGEDGETIVGWVTQPTEVTTRIGNILNYELNRWEALSPPANIKPYLNIHHFPNEARTTAYTTPRQMTAGTHIQNLARYAGVDWTVVGRAFHVWDVSRALGRTRVLTEKDFLSEIIVTEYGADLALDAYVVGFDGVYGEAHNTDAALRDYYGPWEMVFTNYDEEGSLAPTQEELNSQAKRNLSGRAPAPFEVRVPDNSTIQLSEDLTIRDLVPGVQMPLRATLNSRDYYQMQKLDRLQVIENADGEQIQVTLVPATKPDEDDEED